MGAVRRRRRLLRACAAARGLQKKNTNPENSDPPLRLIEIEAIFGEPSAVTFATARASASQGRQQNRR